MSQLWAARCGRVPPRRPGGEWSSEPARLPGGTLAASAGVRAVVDCGSGCSHQCSDANALAGWESNMSEASAGIFPAGCLVDPDQPLTSTFDGRTIPAFAGHSIGAALYAAGVRIFTRSFKYHRPRGLLCLTGDCPNCLMQVDGKPNVRTCIEPARQGQVVCHQNAWPSLNFDVLNIFDKLHRFLPVGFYYKRFHKPRWLWPIFEHMVRHIAGLGRIDVDHVPNCE